MKENQNIEELLNCFLDGELTERQHVEVQRLISHDVRVAQRLRELQQCKRLVNSLPYVEAPVGMFERIRTSLEKRTFLEQEPEVFEERKGARYLLVRKVLAAAAMIGLLAVLGAVVYTIVVPESPPAGVEFTARLELKTSDTVAVDGVIRKAIEDSHISGQSSGTPKGGKVYTLSCGREAFSSLMGELENIWEGFDSARLLVETRTPGQPVVVEGVKPDQIAELITPPKPTMTKRQEEIEKPAVQARGEPKVHLTIVLVGSE